MIRVLLLCMVACTNAPLAIDEYPCPPSGTSLTYEAFGKQFLAAHCNSCHNASESYRRGAPESFRFDSLGDVRTHRERIFVRAAASNTTMPPGPDDPSTGEREQLAEWLACGAP